MSFSTLDTFKSPKVESLPRLKLPLPGTFIGTRNGTDSDRSRTDVSIFTEAPENFQYLLSSDCHSLNYTLKRHYSRDILRTREATSLNQLAECKSIGDVSERSTPRSNDVTKGILRNSRFGNSGFGSQLMPSFVKPKQTKRVTFSDGPKSPAMVSEELLSKFQWSTPKLVVNPAAVDRPSFETHWKKEQEGKAVPNWLAPIPPAADTLNRIRKSKDRKIVSLDMSAKSNGNVWQIENLNQKGIKFVQKDAKNEKLPPIMPCFLGTKESQVKDQETLIESLVLDGLQQTSEKKMKTTGIVFLTPQKENKIKGGFSLASIWKKRPEKNNDKALFERVN